MKKLIALIVTLFTIGFIPMWINPGKGMVMFDTIEQIIPFITEIKRLISSGTPWWSWNTHLGDNFVAAYSYYHLTNPVVWLVSTLFPVTKIPTVLIIIAYFDAILAGIFSFLYLKKMKFNDTLSICGALLYVFSPFYIVNLKYLNFGDSLMMFPLLLLMLENVLSQKRHCYFWLIVTSLIITSLNFYFAVSSFLLGFFYMVFRISSLDTNRKWIYLWKSTTSVLGGVICAAFILVPTFLHLFGNPRTGLRIPEFYGVKQLIACLILDVHRLLNPQITDGFPYVFNHTIYTSTLGGIALFGFLPAAIYCYRKRNWIAGLLLVLLVIYFTPLNGIFSGFTNPHYTRWLYGMNMILILASLYYLKDFKTISLKSTIIYVIIASSFLIGAMILYFVPIFLDGYGIHFNLGERLEIALFAINIICLILFAVRKSDTKLLIPLTSVCGVLNMVFFVYVYSHGLQNYMGYESQNYTENGAYDNFLSSDRLLKYNDEEFTHRTDFVANYSNLSLLFNMPSLKNFHSINNTNLIEYRELTDSSATAVTICIVRYRESTAALLSVKEIIDYGDENLINAPYRYGLNLVDENHQFKRYNFDYYIPMGFTYDSYVDIDSLRALMEHKNEIDIPLLMLDNIAIDPNESPELAQVMRKGAIDRTVTLDSIAQLRRQHVVKDFVGDTKGFTANTDFDKERVVFFSVVHDPGFKATIDGVPTKIHNVNFGMSAIIVPAGKHTIAFQYLPPGLIIGAVISLIGFIFLIILWFTEDKHTKSLYRIHTDDR